MIKINLATKKRSQLAGSAVPGVGLAGLFERLKSSSAGTMPGLSPQIKAAAGTAVLCLVLGFLADYLWTQQKEQDLERIRAEITNLDDQVRRLESEIAKTSGFEALKRNLENDERAIKLKIQTIERLISERRDPPLILKALSEVTPRDVWLTEFTLKSTEVKIHGSSRGLAPVSDFMKLLEETVYFREVTLKRSTSKRDQGVDLGQFELEAKRK